ncbi:MAG TPA: NADH-quinone oxidoreductase subunit C [Methanocella sp.]|nr:NADH-quinone oxidoreductase subunit C [Methanocella sp.]
MNVKIITQPELQDIARRLKGSGARLITIVGTDAGANIEVTYFFHTGVNKTEEYRIIVPKQGGNEEISGISHIWPAAYVAENEVSEMFGVKIKDVPGRFFLHESVTAPLRRKAP